MMPEVGPIKPAHPSLSGKMNYGSEPNSATTANSEPSRNVPYSNLQSYSSIQKINSQKPTYLYLDQRTNTFIISQQAPQPNQILQSS